MNPMNRIPPSTNHRPDDFVGMGFQRRLNPSLSYVTSNAAESQARAIPDRLIVLSLSDPAVGNPVITAFQQHYQSGDKAAKTDHKADRRPVPMTYVH